MALDELQEFVVRVKDTASSTLHLEYSDADVWKPMWTLIGDRAGS